MSKIHNYKQTGFHEISEYCMFSGDLATIWDEIKECKKQFLVNNIDPRISPWIPPEVAESWIRSKNYRVDPDINYFSYCMPPREFEILLNDKKILIEATADYIKNFIPLLTVSEYLMYLTDENGVLLLLAGAEQEIASFQQINVRQSTVFSEERVGTTAYSLCVRHRKPVQLIGPCHYHTAFQDGIASATPILDNNDVIGTLGVVQLVAKNDLRDLQAHSLGWVISMGNTIENLLKIKRMNNLLETTLSLVGPGIITINKEGLVSHINDEGASILGVQAKDVIDKHYIEFMQGEQKQLVSEVLKSGKPVLDVETTIATNKNKQRFLIYIKPVFSEGEDKPRGAVICLARSDKVDRFVAHRSGAEATYKFEDIIGESPLLNKAIQIAKNVSSYNVLLIGESGTGKELFAQAIHNHYRPDGPFVAINCASVPRNLIESELFGYEGGTFTGAERKGRPGKIELANGGTLFLDEIGDMPIEIQPVLLRVLEDKRVMRLGSNKYIPVDFRLVAATHKDLYQMVHEKSFREDLYFRLSTFKISIPPLRERGNDIILLAQRFIESISNKMKCEIPKLSTEAYDKIKNYNWPGNVRQLENAMVYAVNMAQDGIIQINNLPEELTENRLNDKGNRSMMSVKELEKQAILDAMISTGKNTLEMARILGLGRTTLYRKFKEYDIKL